MKYFYKYFTARVVLLTLAMLLSSPLIAWAQGTITIKGVVTDVEKEPLTGVSIRIKGTTMGTTTTASGSYTLQGVPRTATLIFSYVGMKKQEIPVSGRTTIDVVLEDDAQVTQEVVVVGYGTQKKVNLTGAVSSIDSKSLAARPVQNIGQALQGMIPGLNLSVGNSGGALNSTMSLNIRGAGTIGSGSNSSPLVLIDGSEGDMNALAPSDIESISILKDASASSIYGSRAAFGVLLIKTKSGREGRARVTYSGDVRFSTATQVPEMMDSEQFAKYFNIAGTNSGNGTVFTDEIMKRIIDYKNGTIEEKYRSGTVWNDRTNAWDLYTGAWANTNWFDEMYRKNAPTQEHNLSISGGSGKTNYYLSGALLDRQGLIRYGRDTFKRYNLTAKISTDITPWLTISYTNRWSREEYSRPSYMTALFFHNIARRWPTNPVAG